MNRLLSLSIAPNTKRVYTVGWNAFCQFKGWRPNTIACGSIQDISQFVAWLSLRNLSPRTISTYVAGVGFFHKVNGWEDPTRDFLVTKLLEGCHRDRPSVDSRLPISLPILSDMVRALPHVCSSHFECEMFKAVLLSAFFGFMRVGEFAAHSKHNIQNSLLSISSLDFCHTNTGEASILISFHSCKNNQTGPLKQSV